MTALNEYVPALGYLLDRGEGIMLFEQIGEDTFMCRFCESTVGNYESYEVPSMYAGTDSGEICTHCDAYTQTNPFTGITSIYRKTALDISPKIGSVES